MEEAMEILAGAAIVILIMALVAVVILMAVDVGEHLQLYDNANSACLAAGYADYKVADDIVYCVKGDSVVPLEELW